MIGMGHKVRRVAGAPVFTQLDDELLGLDTQRGLAYGLNDSAARVWEMIEEWTSVGEVCAKLETLYAVDHSTCHEQLSELLLELQHGGLVELREGGPAHS